jgi:hypothetical protein
MTGRRSVGTIIFLLLPALLVLGGAAPGTASSTVTTYATNATNAERASATSVCATPARRGFVPLAARIRHVGRNIPVLAMGRGAGRVPLPPPLNSLGKRSFAWDKYGPKPGSALGNVRFNAHTYLDQTWLGNRLLTHLQVGNRIIVYGKSSLLCYRVTKRVVTTPDHLGGYYALYKSPKLAIVVCSGKRLGPGNWTKRTIWYAKPSLR